MAEHTPGPWVIDIEEDDSGPYYFITNANAGREIAGLGNNLADPEDAANAHLLAEAPEMLAALEAIVEAARMSDQPRARYCGEIAAAAIAKARPQANESTDR